MLCSFKQITASTIRTVQKRRLFTHKHSQRCIQDGWSAILKEMSYRFLLRDFNVRIWSSWTRNSVNSVFKRCRRERSVKDVIQCVRQTFFKSRRTFLLAATAAFKSHDDESGSSDKSITDEDLEGLLTELELVEELSRRTLFCKQCGHRLVIGPKCRGVRYCVCKDASVQEESVDGWVPYMETDDVIIWRKEYKHEQGLYAYKVYGRYKEVRACDFAAVQLDGAYRRVWDAAVASLSLVERDANGVKDQAVLHWEVLWPRLFANRDYVYVRRHKEFKIKSKMRTLKDTLFVGSEAEERSRTVERPQYEERPSVHSNAKRKAREAETRLVEEQKYEEVENKVYVIVSRSCEHPKVPETKHAIRVNEYWSHMVVKTLDGTDKTGMEFVLTYYDEPAVGGLPSGVAAWATGRAAPAYLDRMRSAAADYRTWITEKGGQDLQELPLVPDGVSDAERQAEREKQISEQDMESSKLGPELNGEVNEKLAPCEPVRRTRDASTQTDDFGPSSRTLTNAMEDKAVGTSDNGYKIDKKKPKDSSSEEEKSEKVIEEEEKSNSSWWRYLYPFYYFV